MDVVVIPAYQPDEQLIHLVDRLHDEAFGVFVVNDGSSACHDWIFEQIQNKATVIRINHKGKGAALKAGFAAVCQHFPSCRQVITADADGQHKVEDIIRVREALHEGAEFVLTIRDLGKNIPLRSRFGNALSKVVYTVVTGHYFDDNQSGLRGFSVKHLPWLLTVKGNKYDYELNMLCHADKQAIPITPLPIQTIYIDGNKSSHFNPVLDTIRIYKRLFFSVWPSLAAVLLWQVLSLVQTVVFGYRYGFIMVPTVVMITAVFSLFLQKLIVFRKVKYQDGLRMMLYSVIRAAIYVSLVETIAMITQQIPLIFVVDFAAVVMLVIEYYIHKRMHKLKK